VNQKALRAIPPDPVESFDDFAQGLMASGLRLESILKRRDGPAQFSSA
jgi:hypothetical protein